MPETPLHKRRIFAASLIPPLLIAVCGYVGDLPPLTILPIVVLQSCWGILEAAFVMRYRKTAPDLAFGKEGLSLPVVAAAGVLLTVLVSPLYSSPVQKDISDILLLCGFIVGLFGVFLRLIAIYQLADRFLDRVALLPNHTIETGGAYRYIKHPAETGLLLVIAGHVMMCHSIPGLMLFCLWILPVSLCRITLENRMIKKYQSAPRSG